METSATHPSDVIVGQGMGPRGKRSLVMIFIGQLILSCVALVGVSWFVLSQIRAGHASSIAIIGIVVMVLLVFLMIWKVVVAIRFDLHPSADAALTSIVQEPLIMTSDEHVQLMCPGIIRSFVADPMYNRPNDPFHPFIRSAFPENTIVITSRQLIFICVPLLGADLQIVARRNLMFAQNDLEAGLREMLARFSLSQIYASYPKNFVLARSAIANVSFNDTLSWVRIQLTDQAKGPLTYSFNSQENYEKVKNLLKSHLSN